MVTLIGSLNLIFKELVKLAFGRELTSYRIFRQLSKSLFHRLKRIRYKAKKSNPLINSETPADIESTGVLHVGSLAMTYFHWKYNQLSSALKRFTVLFGMGRSGTATLWSPG